MKTAWVCIWVALAAAEVGLTLWSRSARFLEIGALALIMIAYNLMRLRADGRAPLQVAVDVSHTTPVIS